MEIKLLIILPMRARVIVEGWLIAAAATVAHRSMQVPRLILVYPIRPQVGYPWRRVQELDISTLGGHSFTH